MWGKALLTPRLRYVRVGAQLTQAPEDCVASTTLRLGTASLRAALRSYCVSYHIYLLTAARLCSRFLFSGIKMFKYRNIVILAIFLLSTFSFSSSASAQSCTDVVLTPGAYWYASDVPLSPTTGYSFIALTVPSVNVMRLAQLHPTTGLWQNISILNTSTYYTYSSFHPLRVFNDNVEDNTFQYCAPVVPTATATVEPTSTPELIVTSTPVPTATVSPADVLVQRATETRDLTVFYGAAIAGMLVLLLIRR